MEIKTTIGMRVENIGKIDIVILNKIYNALTGDTGILMSHGDYVSLGERSDMMLGLIATVTSKGGEPLPILPSKCMDVVCDEEYVNMELYSYGIGRSSLSPFTITLLRTIKRVYLSEDDKYTDDDLIDIIVDALVDIGVDTLPSNIEDGDQKRNIKSELLLQ